MSSISPTPELHDWIEKDKIAIQKAKTIGVGIVTMNNGAHVGAVGHFSMLAAKQDMVGMCATSAGTGVLPTFAAEPRFGTNPISIAAPARNEAPLLFDAATSQIAGNKFSLAKRVGSDLLPGWIADDTGTPILEETPVPEGSWYGNLLPLGGTRELGSHKGYGIALMVDVLCGVLSGNGAGFLHAVPRSCSQYFQAIRIDAFRPADEFKRDMDLALRTLRELEPTTGNDQVYYAGMQRAALKADRIENGIPLPQHTVGTLKDLANEFEVEFPRVI